MRTALALAILALLATPSARAETFTILLYESPKQLSARTDPARSAGYWGTYNSYAGELQKAGVLRGGSALAEAGGHTARGKGGADQGVKGTRLGGYFVIEVADLKSALVWAKKAPKGAVTVEVRPHRPNPMMGSAPGSAKGVRRDAKRAVRVKIARRASRKLAVVR